MEILDRIFPGVMRRMEVGALVLACVLCSCARDSSHPSSPAKDAGNSVATFLRNAERQAETDEQRKEIQRALGDMLKQSPAQLRQARYADYTGKPNSWSITDVLRHYFVPNPQVALDDSRFFEDFQAPEARGVIQHQLDEVTKALP